MISREKICMEWDGWRDFKYVIPITKKIIDACPINNESNINAAYETLLETLTYDHLKESVLYELKLRKRIYYELKKNYNKNEKYPECVDKLLANLKIIQEKQPELSRLAINIMNSYYNELENNLKENDTLKHKLDYNYQIYINPEYTGVIQKTLDHYLGLVPAKNNTPNPNNMISKFLNLETDHELFIQRFVYKREYEMLGKKINLFGFCPDTTDFRNILVPTIVDNYRSRRIKEKEEFDNNIFYDNPGRPFEDLLSAVLGRELVITYLNKLEKII